MRKRLITPSPKDVPHLDEGWLDLDREAVVEVTSEDKDYPVESALVTEEMQGWRAADYGTQTNRLIFDEPQRLKHIALIFGEAETDVPKSLFCDSLPMAGAHFERLCVSSGISVPLIQSA